MGGMCGKGVSMAQSVVKIPLGVTVLWCCVVLQRQKQEQCTYSLSLGRCLVVIIGYRPLQQENEE